MKKNQAFFNHCVILGLCFFVPAKSFADPIVYQGFSLDAPPAVGSPEALADLTAVHDWQNTRTAAECAEAESESTLNFENTFGPSTGVLTEDEVQLANAVATNVFNEVANITGYYKSLFQRLRPYVQDTTIVPCVTLPGGYSYPSTHATTGYAMALTLSDLFPAKSAIIMQQGEQIGENRIIGGVHFPSDVAAGQGLGEQIYEAMKNAPAPSPSPSPTPAIL